MIPPCGFKLHFSMYFPSVILFGEMPFHVFCPFANCMYVWFFQQFRSSFHILDMNPVQIMQFVNIFSKSVLAFSSF